MAERRLVVDHLKFSYDGLFNVEELYAVISGWFFEKGWDWHEKLNQELTTAEGRQIRIVLEPWKSAGNYNKLKMGIKINLSDLKEVEVKHEKESLRLSQGQVRITFDGYVISDRRGEWSKKPLSWFLSIVAEKYFFREHFAKFEDWIRSDVDDLHQKVKNYLNVFKYTYQT